MERLLDTVSAAKALTDLGVPRSAKTLRKLRCVGGGPLFRRLGAKPVYRMTDLEAWIEARLSAPAANNAALIGPKRSNPASVPTPRDPVAIAGNLWAGSGELERHHNDRSPA